MPKLEAVEVLVPRLAPKGRLLTAGGDTTNDKFGKPVPFAALSRHGVHSRRSCVVELAADGAYACEDMAGHRPAKGVFTPRPRLDAMSYALPRKSRKPRRGRPRQRGKRLLAPPRLAKRVGAWLCVKV